MLIEPDAIHEGEDGIYLDCPQCGSNASIEQIVTRGHCSGHVNSEVKDAVDDANLQGDGCTAELALELVWES
jgi:hypothetical protein